MDTAEEHDRFIAAQNGGVFQNGKTASNNGKSNGFPTNECDQQMYKSVAVCVEPKVQLHTQPCKRRRCLVIGIIVIVAIIVLAAAALLVLYLCAPRKMYTFSRSSSNYTYMVDSSAQTGANETAKPYGIQPADGKPFWTTCPDQQSLATVHAVYTKDCVIPEGYDQRCTVKKGTEGIMQVVFTPNRDLQQLRITSCGTLSAFPIFGCVKQELNQPDACRDSNLQCPLRAGQTYMYSAMESVRINLVDGTEFNVDTQVTLFDASNDDVVFCVIIPIRVYI